MFITAAVHLLADNINMSALFPSSSDPHWSDRPSDAAALMVPATSDSSIVKPMLTQARCITNGYRRQDNNRIIITG